MSTATAVFAAAFVALYAAHMVADHWVQSGWQAANKGRHEDTGRRACTAHVASYTATQAAFVAAAAVVTGMRTSPVWAAAGLAVSAGTHYWADRRHTLAALADRCGKAASYRLRQSRPVEAVTVMDVHGDRPAGLCMTRDDRHVALYENGSEVPFDNPCLGTGAYALDQSFHIGCLFVAALLIAGGAA